MLVADPAGLPLALHPTTTPYRWWGRIFFLLARTFSNFICVENAECERERAFGRIHHWQGAIISCRLGIIAIIVTITPQFLSPTPFPPLRNAGAEQQHHGQPVGRLKKQHFSHIFLAFNLAYRALAIFHTGALMRNPTNALQPPTLATHSLDLLAFSLPDTGSIFLWIFYLVSGQNANA